MTSDVKDAAPEAITQLQGPITPNAVLVAAHSLPRAHRAELAQAMLKSLDDEDADPADVDAAWDKELRRRVEDLHAGRLQTVSAEEVLADLDAIVNDDSEP